MQLTARRIRTLALAATIGLAVGAGGPAAAQEFRNGYLLPPRGDYRVLILFAEIDFDQGPCPSGLGPGGQGSWVGQVPSWAGDLFDPVKLPVPSAFLTDLYRQASFGRYDLLGDHYPKVFTVPCHEIHFGFNHVPVLERLAAEADAGPILTAAGLPLAAFDLWSLTGAGTGELKREVPDGRIDSVYVLWRNNRFLNGLDTKCQSGFGVASAPTALQIGNLQGVETVSSYNACGFPLGITAKEHMHGIFGGNQWHSGGGAGTHATFAIPWVYGLTAQAQTMLTVNAWDRWMLEWEHPDKNPNDDVFISVGDQATGELPSDISMESHPAGASFVLRDFLTTGDAVRVKLPHLAWQQPGDQQNQYLWLENRRMKGRLDEYYYEACADRGAYPTGTPGIYAYVQVGKDRKIGPGLYGGGDYELPNYAASWIFPVTAEGNYDFAHRTDLIQEGIGKPCNWGNPNVPIDPSASLPNAFTGLSDLSGRVDSNEDGVLGAGDLITGLSELVDGAIVHNFHVGGDWEDAFGPITGKRELSLSTNPAPVPVYTHRHPGPAADSDNRTIWLSGLAITFDEVSASPEEILVTIRWDDYTVDGDVRWTGDIKLSPHDFDPAEPSLVLAPGATVLLDRGLSPTRRNEQGGFFSDPTVFTALPGSIAGLEPGSVLRVVAGSELRLATGSRLIVAPGARVELASGGRLVVEDGAEVVVGGDGLIDVASGGALVLANRTAEKGLALADAESRVRVTGSLTTVGGADLTFRGGGYLRFEPGNQVDLSPGSAVVLQGLGPTDRLVSIAPQTVVSFEAVRAFVRDGAIEYGDGSRLDAIGTGTGLSQAFFQRLRFQGVGGFASGAVGLHASGFRRVVVSQSTVRGLEKGILLSDMPKGLPSVITDVRFEDCVLPLGAIALRTLHMTRIQTAPHCLDGLQLRQIERVTVAGGDIGFHQVAIALEDVGSLSVSGGRIRESGTGILAVRSDVTLRNGAVLESNRVGIDSHGEPDALARVTVGDTGCETSIINNDLGIRIQDTLLALDAVDHACDGSSCSELRPNRLEGNDQLVRGCFTAPPPSITLEARGNYWGGGAAPSSAIQIAASCDKPGNDFWLNDSFYFEQPPRGCRLEGLPVFEEELPHPAPPVRVPF